MKKIINSPYFGIIVFILFLVATLTQNKIIQLLGVILFFYAVILCDIENSIILLVMLAPNIAIIKFPWINFGILRVGFGILLFRLQIWRELKNIKLIVAGVIVAVITLSRVVYGNFYDFITYLFEYATIIFCIYVAQNDIFDVKKIINSFKYGCLLMLFSMLVHYTISQGADGRPRALGDDSNYTAIIFLVLFIISFICYIYKFDTKYNLVYMLIGLAAGLFTGSRGFLLSLIIIMVIEAVRGFFYRNERFVTYIILTLFFIVTLLYLLRFEPVVLLFDKTIGRTLNLKSNYNSGDFMDITSGRVFLWKYYISHKITGVKELMFGTGFHNYHLIENGGYALEAHNMYISGTIGVGLIGLCIMLYFFGYIISIGLKKSKNNWIILLVPIGVMVEYFFLDGLFDIRIPIYLLVMVCVSKLFSDKINL